MPAVLAKSSLESLLRRALSDHPVCLRAYDLAIRSLVEENAPFRVSPAMRAEAAAAILDLAGSGHLTEEELAKGAVCRVRGTDFRVSLAAQAV